MSVSWLGEERRVEAQAGQTDVQYASFLMSSFIVEWVAIVLMIARISLFRRDIDNEETFPS